MNTICGESGRYLDINLTTETFAIFKVEDEILNQYLGGKGLGLKLIYDRLGGDDGSGLAGVEPLGEENILAFMIGSFLGTKAPCSARFAGVTKSPLTGIMVASSCGGAFGMACRTAGWDGLLVSGKAQNPTTISIDENGVLYSVIRSGHRYLGRGGMGAVMGAKNVKAIVATGRAYKIEPADPDLFKKMQTLSKKYIIGNSFIKHYRYYGTNSGVLPGMKTGFSPVRNFKNRTDPRLTALSGEAMAEKYQTKHSVCASCAVLCGKKGTYPDGEVRQIPEYETIITGRKLTERKMLQAGRRIHVLERHMNCLMGIRKADDTLPGCFLNEADTKHPDKKTVKLEPMLKQYYRSKGYDSNGLPTRRILKKPGINRPQQQVKEKE